MILRLPGREIRFPRRPLVMGILNVNDDSFCADGSLDPEVVLKKGRQMVADGADILDFGAESARTNREAIPVAEEVARLKPIFARWPECYEGVTPADEDQVFPPVISLNTWRPGVFCELAKATPGRIEILNDLSALPDSEMARLCAAEKCALLIMHSVGRPKVAHLDQTYPDIMATLDKFFRAKIEMARNAGVPEEAILIDPGLDFAKQLEDNLTIMRELERLHVLGRPVLLPVSRKTFIGEVLGIGNPADRDAGTIAGIVFGQKTRASIFRVHNVEAAWIALKVTAPFQDYAS